MAAIMAFDLDGTLTLDSHGHDEDMQSVYELRQPNPKGRALMQLARKMGYVCIVFTGRSEIYRSSTWAWLRINKFPCHYLFMEKPHYTIYVGDRVGTVDSVYEQLSAESNKEERPVKEIVESVPEMPYVHCPFDNENAELLHNICVELVPLYLDPKISMPKWTEMSPDYRRQRAYIMDKYLEKYEKVEASPDVAMWDYMSLFRNTPHSEYFMQTPWDCIEKTEEGSLFSQALYLFSKARKEGQKNAIDIIQKWRSEEHPNVEWVT